MAQREPGAAEQAPEFQIAGASKRYLDWVAQLRRNGMVNAELLLPQLAMPCPKDLPELMLSGDRVANANPEKLRKSIQELKPWGYGVQLMKGVATEPTQLALDRMIYRSHLISGAVRQLLGDQLTDCSFIDFACNHGYFSLEMAYHGARSALGVDLRAENVAKANFLKNHFQLANASFRQQDIYTLDTEDQFDVVFNLGVMYHITDPYRLVKLSYDLCRRFAVIDSVMHKEPVSAYIQRVNKDVSLHAEGKFDVELHPTYRAVIDLMHAVGFKQVIEVVRAPSSDGNDCPHSLYDKFDRRCLIGFKQPMDLPELQFLPVDQILPPSMIKKKSNPAAAASKKLWARIFPK